MSFITDLATAAQKAGKEFNILPSLILAQACLESNYGKSGLAVKGKNLFGIKGKFEGQGVSMRTAEYKSNGDKYYIEATFRKYPSWYESLQDLCLLYTNGVSWDRAKYHKVIGETDIEKACKAVRAAGYATDPKYAEYLMNVVRQYNLTQYDKQQDKPKTSIYIGTSIVDYLKSVGKDNSYAARSKLARDKGIKNYSGTAGQNTQLLKSLRGF